MASPMVFTVRVSDGQHVTECPRCPGHKITAGSYKKLVILAASHARQVHDTTNLRFRAAR